MNIDHKTFLDLISKNINQKKEDLSLDTKIKELKNWDSLTNVRVVIALQSKTKKKFNLSKIYNFKSLRELFDKINEIN
jgi:acyl carrier protein